MKPCTTSGTLFIVSRSLCLWRQMQWILCTNVFFILPLHLWSSMHISGKRLHFFQFQATKKMCPYPVLGSPYHYGVLTIAQGCCNPTANIYTYLKYSLKLLVITKVYTEVLASALHPTPLLHSSILDMGLNLDHVETTKIWLKHWCNVR